MLSNLFKINFLAVLLTGILSLSPTIHASDYLIHPNSKSAEEIIDFLNTEEQKPFLIDLNKQIFERDKNEAYIVQKMCTHGQNVIDEWKKFTKPKPTEFPFKSAQWNSMLSRRDLCTFNPNLSETPQAIIQKQLTTPDEITVRKASGDGATAIIIVAKWNENEIGIETKDTSLTILTPTKRNADNRSQPDSGMYITKFMNVVEVRYDISDIVNDIKAKGLKESGYNVNNQGKITTICPSDN